MAKKPKYRPKPFESRGEKFIGTNGKLMADTSANIYESLLTSEAFKNLTVKQRLLYIYCKSQYYGHRKPEKDFPDIDDFQGADLFYLNWASVQKYGLYTKTMHSNFYKDMGQLITHGFISRVSSGKHSKSKTIYKFSSGWHTWEKE